MSYQIDVCDDPAFIHKIEDVLIRDYQVNKVPYSELIVGPKTAEILHRLLAPYKHPDVLELTSLHFRHGTLQIICDPDFPEGHILLT